MANSLARAETGEGDPWEMDPPECPECEERAEKEDGQGFFGSKINRTIWCGVMSAGIGAGTGAMYMHPHEHLPPVAMAACGLSLFLAAAGLLTGALCAANMWIEKGELK